MKIIKEYLRVIYPTLLGFIIGFILFMKKDQETIFRLFEFSAYFIISTFVAFYLIRKFVDFEDEIDKKE